MEKQVIKTQKETWMDNLRGKYPDKDFTNEDDFYAASMEGYDALKKEHKDQNQRYEDDNKFVMERLSANPDVFNFVTSLISGESLPKAMAKLKSLYDLEEGTPEWDEYNKEVEERKARDKRAEEDLATYKANMGKSAETLQKFADKNGLSEEEMTDLVNGFTTMIQDKVFAGNFDEDFLEKMYRLQNYDKEMSAAEEAGRIAGRNDKINNKNAKRFKTDGLPATTAASGEGATKAPKDPREAMIQGLAKRNSEYEGLR